MELFTEPRPQCRTNPQKKPKKVSIQKPVSVNPRQTPRMIDFIT